MLVHCDHVCGMPPYQVYGFLNMTSEVYREGKPLNSVSVNLLFIWNVHVYSVLTFLAPAHLREGHRTHF